VEPAASPPTPVTLHVVAADTTAQGERYSANVEPYGVVQVAAQVEGQILELRQVSGAGGERAVQAGDVVEAEAVLARVDPAPYLLQVQAAEDALAGDEARMLAAQDQHQRFVEAGDAVARSKVENSLANYDAAKARVGRARAALEQARIQLSHCDVKAPRAGLLLSRRVEVGDLARPGATLFELGDTRRMKVVFDVPADVAQGIATGTTLKLSVPSLEQREYEGPVTGVDPKADARSRLFGVELTVDNEDGRLRSGMIASLVLPEPGAGAPPALVPLDAVVRPPGEASAFAVYVGEPAEGAQADRLTARLREVELGRVRGDEVEVRSGLAAGDRVIVRGSTLVQDGAAVRAIP
jgi:RND family efflux transporter MFP subunit